MSVPDPMPEHADGPPEQLTELLEQEVTETTYERRKRALERLSHILIPPDTPRE